MYRWPAGRGLTAQPQALQHVQEALALPPRDALAHHPEHQEQEDDAQHDQEEVVGGDGGAGADDIGAAAASVGVVSRLRGQHCRMRCMWIGGGLCMQRPAESGMRSRLSTCSIPGLRI